MRKQIVVLALLGALVASGSAVAANVGSAVSIKLSSSGAGDKFTGKVTSSKSKCIHDRKVTVYLVEGASPTPSQDSPIGTAVTGDTGKYKVVPTGGFASPGDFYAVAKRRVAGSATCAKAMSEIVSNGTG